jgi:hypothetical protein
MCHFCLFPSTMATLLTKTLRVSPLNYWNSPLRTIPDLSSPLLYPALSYITAMCHLNRSSLSCKCPRTTHHSHPYFSQRLLWPQLLLRGPEGLRSCSSARHHTPFCYWSHTLFRSPQFPAYASFSFLFCLIVLNLVSDWNAPGTLGMYFVVWLPWRNVFWVHIA